MQPVRGRTDAPLRFRSAVAAEVAGDMAGGSEKEVRFSQYCRSIGKGHRTMGCSEIKEFADPNWKKLNRSGPWEPVFYMVLAHMPVRCNGRIKICVVDRHKVLISSIILFQLT